MFHRKEAKIKLLITIAFIVTVIALCAANASVFAVGKFDFNTLSDCDKIYCDTSDSGAFGFGFNKNTLYTQSFVPAVRSYSFKVDGGFVGAPFLDDTTVCAVYMSNDFNYHIVRMNCLSGEVSFPDSNIIDDFNCNDLSICGNRIYIIKYDEVYCYVSAYSFEGRHIRDYRFDGKNVNEITTNNGCTYVFLYDGSVYRLTESRADYCGWVRDSSDFYNCGVNYLSDSKKYIYSLKENTEYTFMYGKSFPFAVDESSVYYSNGTTLYSRSLEGSCIKSCSLGVIPDKLLSACGKTVAISDSYKTFSVISDSDFKDIDFENNNGKDETKPAQNNSSNNHSDKSEDYIFTDEGILCNVSEGTTAARLKKDCPQITQITDKNGNEISGKLKTGMIVITDDGSFCVAVRGDITGTGSVNSNDVKMLMNTFIEKNQISGAYEKAADYNLDGSVDNKDLVLIAQEKQN